MAKKDLQGYPDWSEAEKNKVNQTLFAMISDYDRNMNKAISTGNLYGLAAYNGNGNSQISQYGYMSDIDNTQQLGSSSAPRVSLNLTAAMIDTLVAKLSSLEIIPKAITNKGNAHGRQLANNLNDIISGIENKYKIKHLVNLAKRDAMINRVGYIKVVPENKKAGVDLKVERVYSNEVIIDPSDGYYNDPYKMIHRKIIPKSVAIKLFPKFKQQIEDSQVIEVRQAQNTMTYTPSIMIAEAWCKNTYLKNGRHVIAIENQTFVDEDYDKDYFPIIKLDYNEPVIGWLGQSVVEELSPLQKEVDRILATMQAIMKLVSIPRIFYDVNSMMNPDHFTNKVGLMIGMDLKNGVAPIIHNGAGMPPELMIQLQFIVSQMYSRVGLTQTDTQGQQPMGIESGEALKTLGNIAAERWTLLKKNYEQDHIKVVEVVLKEMSEHSITVNTLDKKIGLKQISSKVIPKDFDSFVLQVLPVSSLPTDPAGKIDTVERWVQNGWVDKDSAAELLNMPDLEAYTTMKQAPRDFIDISIEDMLANEEYIAPEPYDNLDYAVMTALQNYSWERLNGKNETKLKLLRRYINDCQSLIRQLQQPAIAQGVNNNANGSQPSTPSSGTPS